MMSMHIMLFIIIIINERKKKNKIQRSKVIAEEIDWVEDALKAKKVKCKQELQRTDKVIQQNPSLLTLPKYEILNFQVLVNQSIRIIY